MVKHLKLRLVFQQKMEVGILRSFASILTLLALIGCTDNTVDLAEPIRGLRTFEVVQQTQFVERRYPSVIQPHNETRLAFEVSGQLEAFNLVEGQTVSLDDVLLKLDPSTFELHVQEMRANVAQLTASHRNALSNFERQSELLEGNMIARSVFDDAEAAMDTAQARLNQTNKALEIANDSLTKTELRAPFTGIVTDVGVDSFATISPGQHMLTLYSDTALQTGFTVPSSVINFLSLGQTVRILVSDLPNAEFLGRITELGVRASDVSAFPIVAVLDEAPQRIKSGMSADVLIDVALPESGEGFLIPITCFAFKMTKRLNPDRTDIPIFVYDPISATVQERRVDVIGIRENMVIIDAGLKAGELVASAGVSYLRHGQSVFLLSAN
jgi:RND family efflux transporter MFP subunit